MKKIYLFVTICLTLTACNKDDDKNKEVPNIRILSFDQFVNSPSPEKKELELFLGEKIKGSIVSLGMKTRNFFIYPDDELVIYAIKGITNIELEQGEYSITTGQAAFLPKGTAYRLSSKNDKTETKVLIIQSNKGKMFRLQPEIDQ